MTETPQQKRRLALANGMSGPAYVHAEGSLLRRFFFFSFFNQNLLSCRDVSVAQFGCRSQPAVSLLVGSDKRTASSRHAVISKARVATHRQYNQYCLCVPALASEITTCLSKTKAGTCGPAARRGDPAECDAVPGRVPCRRPRRRRPEPSSGTARVGRQACTMLFGGVKVL